MAGSVYPFRKMNGLGNDFAVFDARLSGLRIDGPCAMRIADRSSGIGCDQVIILEPSQRADVFMRILNPDGSEVNACGNATRCIAALVAAEQGRDEVTIETGAGFLRGSILGDGGVTVDMGPPRLGWADIPLARAFDDTATLDLRFDGGAGAVLDAPGVVNVGNPHCVFIVADLDRYDLAAIGPRIEYDPLFPERVNVSLVQVLGRDAIRLAVWERGAGLTLACGSAACAAAVATARKGLTARKVTVGLPGGNLQIEWRDTDDHILMTGPWQLDYEGVFEFDQPALVS